MSLLDCADFFQALLLIDWFRFIWSGKRALEVLPGDGSGLRSHGLSGHFFAHLINSHGKIEEKLYSTAQPPPDIPNASYSIANILRTASK